MNTRIKKLRKALDLTQQEFASRIGTSQNSLAGYEAGRRNPSSSVINNICKEFHVNEEWLRTGDGEMFRELSRDDEIAAFIETVMRDESAEFKRRLIAALAKLNDAGWDALEQFIEDMTRQKASQRDEYPVAGIPVTALEPWAEQPPAASPLLNFPEAPRENWEAMPTPDPNRHPDAPPWAHPGWTPELHAVYEAYEAEARAEAERVYQRILFEKEVGKGKVLWMPARWDGLNR